LPNRGNYSQEFFSIEPRLRIGGNASGDERVGSHREGLLYDRRRTGQNAAGMLDNIDVIHWMITSCNECVDVISECEPTVDSLPR
jgi:hypothetical protein